MCTDGLIIGGVDSHPERDVKLSKFLNILTCAFGDTYLISSICPSEYKDNLVHFKMTKIFEDQNGRFLKILDFVLFQVYICIYMIRKFRSYDVVFLLRGYPLPALVGRLMKKRVIRFHGGPSKEQRDFSFVERFSLEELPNLLATVIVVPARGCVDHFGLKDHDTKVVISPFHIDPEMERRTSLGEREHAVGYLGELSENKGVDRLLKAIRILNENRQDGVELKVGGVGELESKVRDHSEFVDYQGWVDHDDVPSFMNSIRLFVLPSNSEGLPTVLIESMACGTPVLASPVGGVPDLVDNERNGYLLPDTTPETIAETISGVLNEGNLQGTADKAERTVQTFYSKNITIDRFLKIVKSNNSSSNAELRAE